MSTGGIDVSDYQDSVNWPAVAGAGVAFALTKATEGVTFVAASFARNWAGIAAAGLIRGAYHFFRPLDDPQTQADHFLSTVRPGPADLPPALDVEVREGVDAGTFVARMQQWLDVVARVTGRRPMIYATPGFLEGLGSPRAFSGYPLWIADYERSAPMIPRGWSTYTIWQYTDRGSVPGVARPVDLNIFNGTLDELRAFVATGQAPAAGRVSDDFLYAGDTGPEVKEIQSLLQARGFDVGSVDGVFGPRTKAAVLAFQKAGNLIADGVVGPQTLTRLRA